MSAYSKLRRRHQLFADAYVRLGVGTDAYREAFPDAKRPDVSACKLMARPAVKEAIAERTEQAIARAGVRQVRVLEELAAIAFADLAELFDEQGNLRKLKDVSPRARAAIQAIDCEELLIGRGEERKPFAIVRKLRTHSKVEALKLLGQHLTMFKELHEHTGKDGGPIETKDTSELSDLDRARRVAFLLAQGLRESQAKEASAPDPGNPAADDSTST